jgi:hypothetical protein
MARARPATASSDDDGNRLTDRWQASIPWTSLGSTNGINGITNMWLYGLIVSDGTNGNDRYISGNYLGQSVTPGTSGNYGFTFVTLDGIAVGLPTPDENFNGIPDDWELEHFGSIGVMNDTVGLGSGRSVGPIMRNTGPVRTPKTPSPICGQRK